MSAFLCLCLFVTMVDGSAIYFKQTEMAWYNISAYNVSSMRYEKSSVMTGGYLTPELSFLARVSMAPDIVFADANPSALLPASVCSTRMLWISYDFEFLSPLRGDFGGTGLSQMLLLASDEDNLNNPVGLGLAYGSGTSLAAFKTQSPGFFAYKHSNVTNMMFRTGEGVGAKFLRNDRNRTYAGNYTVIAHVAVNTTTGLMRPTALSLWYRNDSGPQESLFQLKAADFTNVTDVVGTRWLSPTFQPRIYFVSAFTNITLRKFSLNVDDVCATTTTTTLPLVPSTSLINTTIASVNSTTTTIVFTNSTTAAATTTSGSDVVATEPSVAEEQEDNSVYIFVGVAVVLVSILIVAVLLYVFRKRIRVCGKSGSDSERSSDSSDPMLETSVPSPASTGQYSSLPKSHYVAGKGMVPLGKNNNPNHHYEQTGDKLGTGPLTNSGEYDAVGRPNSGAYDAVGGGGPYDRITSLLSTTEVQKKSARRAAVQKNSPIYDSVLPETTKGKQSPREVDVADVSTSSETTTQKRGAAKTNIQQYDDISSELN